jgi:hypothetical protein
LGFVEVLQRLRSGLDIKDESGHGKFWAKKNQDGKPLALTQSAILVI